MNVTTISLHFLPYFDNSNYNSDEIKEWLASYVVKLLFFRKGVEWHMLKRLPCPCPQKSNRYSIRAFTWYSLWPHTSKGVRNTIGQTWEILNLQITFFSVFSNFKWILSCDLKFAIIFKSKQLSTMPCRILAVNFKLYREKHLKSCFWNCN